METDVRYLITLAAGLLAAGIVFVIDLKRNRFRPLAVFPCFAAGAVFAFVLGKTVFLLCNTYHFSLYGASCLIRPEPSEFSFVGCCLGFVLGIVLIFRMMKMPVRKALDCFAAAGCILVAFGRFAENFAGELALVELSSFGLEEMTAESPLAFFPLAVEDMWGQRMLSASTVEAVWALLCAAAGILIPRRMKREGPDRAGTAFEFCVFCLCACHFFADTARIVSLVFFYVHVEQVICAVMMLILLIRMAKAGKRHVALPVVLFAVFLSLNGLSQYLLDKPWHFSSIMPENVFQWLNGHLAPFCYSVMLATTLGILLTYLVYCMRFFGMKEDKS